MGGVAQENSTRTLIVLRHAKSSWSESGISDADRPLAPRGRKAAPRMGAFIAEALPAPSHVLCSTARRARQTLDLVLPLLPVQPVVDYLPELYLTDPETHLACLQALPADVSCAMIVGHNPDLQDLALELAGSGKSEALERLATKFPTAAVAGLTFEAPGWNALDFGTCRLSLFMTPKLLA